MSAALPTVRLANSTWRKSSRSNQGGTNGNCVEVAFVNPVIAVRDSKNPSSGTLVVPAASWAGFLADLASEHTQVRACGLR